MPATISRFTLHGWAGVRHLAALAVFTLATSTPVVAQQAASDPGAFTGLGGAVAGGPGFTGVTPPNAGLRGTTDATDDNGPGDPYHVPGSNTANLGTAARPKQANLPPLRGTAMPDRYPVALSKLQAYPRSVRLRKGAGDDVELIEDIPTTPTTAALPVPARKVVIPDTDPFGPVGYGIGSTRIFPYVEQSFGFDSNPEQVSTGVKGSAFSRTEGGFTVQSNWSAHELRGTVHGGYDEFFSNPRADRPDAAGIMDLRIDATRDTQIDAEGRFTIDTQRPGSPELDVAVRDRPLITSLGTTVGITQAFGRFSVGLHGLYDRTDYDNAELTDGTPINLDYQDVNDFGVKGRLGYDLKPGLQPFVEIGYDRRIHDDTVDPFGYRRDSDGVGARLGTSFELWPQLTGTVSAGYAARFYDDPRLKDLTGPTAAASIAWAATPLTTLTLQGSTAFNETTVIGSSGIESRGVTLAISHALFRYLTLTGSLGYEEDDYVGVPITEQTLTASLKAEYHLTRSLVLTGTLSHQNLHSTVQGDGYDQEIAMVGLRLQH